MLGLGLGIGVAQTAPLRRYSIGGKAPAVVADYSSGIYGLNGTPVAFDGLFSFARLSAVWKRNALGHWVKVLAGEPRTGHHIWQGGQLVPAGVAICSEVRTQFLPYASAILENWGSPDSDLFDVGDDFVRVTSLGSTLFPRVGRLCLESGGNSLAAFSEHVDLGLIRPRGQV
jgi:hypothetical protein